ncbi:unnamed protein product, partial [marine sediment metagenome]
MKKTLMIIAIVAIVVIAGSLLYYYVFFRPGIEKAEIRLQEEKQSAEELRIENEKKNKEQEELNKKVALSEALVKLAGWYDDDLDSAYKTYVEEWNAECKRLGKAPDSPLPGDLADKLGERYDQAVKRIDELYQSS